MKQKIIGYIENYKTKQSNIYQKISNILKKIKFDKTIFFIFLAIFILLYFIHSVVYMYFDDFGNAAISYAYVTPGVNGTDYTFEQLLEWAKHIYMEFSGRILYAVLFIIPLLKNGISTYMLIQSIVITLIILYMYKIIIYITNLEKHKEIVPIAIMALYLVIDMLYLQHGTFWASASILYIWPLLPTFAFIYYFMQTNDKFEKKEKYRFLMIPILIVLSFFATCSQEQIGVGIVAFVVIYIFCKQFKNWKKYLVLDIPILLTTIASFLIIFLAPGNWVRMDSNTEFASLNFFEKIALNFPHIMKLIFIDPMNNYMIILTLAMIFMIGKIIIDKCIKNNKYGYLSLVIGFVVLVINYLLLQKTLNPEYQKVLLSIFGILWFIEMFVVIIIYFKNNKSVEIISISFCALASIFSLLMAPYMEGRSVLPFIFMMILFDVIVIIDVLKYKEIFSTMCIYAMLIVVMIVGVRYTIKNYEGYKSNYGINKLNYELLENYKESDGKKITLYKIANLLYASAMPYNTEGIEFWMKEYFNIPQDVEFVWVDCYEKLR